MNSKAMFIKINKTSVSYFVISASKVKYTFDDEESDRADNSDDEIMRPINSENFNHHSETESHDFDKSDTDDGFKVKPNSAPAAATKRPNSKKILYVFKNFFICQDLILLEFGSIIQFHFTYFIVFFSLYCCVDHLL